MSQLRSLFRNHAWLAVALLALALIGRAAVPAGYMPDAGRGVLTVKICGTGAAWSIPLGDKPAKPKRAEQPCAFAASAALALPPTLAELATPTIRHSAFALRNLPLVRLREAIPRPPSRGPPGLA